MPENFDPYYEWLGIPPKHQPPHHYRLLGLELFEPNANVIERAADRQMAHVRTFQSGKHALQSQQLLNELSAAKICLLTPDKKSEYDARLRSQLAAAVPPPVETPAIAVADNPAVRSLPRIARTSARRPVRRPFFVAAVAVICFAAVVAFVLLQVSDGGRRPEPARPLPPLVSLPPLVEETDETVKKPAPSASAAPAVAAEAKQTIADPGDDALLADVPEALREQPASGTGGMPLAAGGAMPSAPAQASAVRLSGRQSLIIDNSATLADFRSGFTAEMWFRLATSLPPTGVCLLGKAVFRDPAGMPSALTGWLVMLQGAEAQASRPDQVTVRWGVDGAPPLESHGTIASLDSSWHHLAVCYSPAVEADGEFRIWLDGQSVVHQQHRAQGEVAAPVCLGVGEGYPAELVTLVDVRAFRLSSAVRYANDFTPDSELAKDESVVCLLDFRNDPGDRLADASGSGHAGRLAGGTRVSVDSEPFAPSPEFMESLPRIALDSRLPVPDEATATAAAAQLRETYQKELAAARDPADMLGLSAEMLRTASTATDTPAQYALLMEARNLAAAAGNLHYALRAVHSLTERFQLDRWATRAEVLGKVVPAAKSAADRKAVAEIAMGLLDQALRDGASESAEKIANTLVQLSRRMKDPVTTRVVNLRVREVSPHRKMREQAAAARTALKENPDDPEANLVLGRYLCFLTSNWAAGLPHLAAGKDAALCELARKEQANPAAADEQVALAESWVEWAKSADESEQNVAWHRAQHWLERALPNLVGLDQTKASGLLAELSAKAAPQATGTSAFIGDWLAVPAGEVRWFNAHGGGVTALAASRSGRWILSGARDDRLRVWDAFAGTMLGEMQTTVNGVASLALSADERTVLVSGGRDAIELWSVASRQPLREFKTDAPARDLALALDGQLLAFAKLRPNKKNIVLADPGTGNGSRELDYPGIPTCFAVSQSGKLVAVASGRGGLVVASLESGKPVPLMGHSERVVDVAFSPNERWLASSSGTEIIVWDRSAGKPQHRLTAGGPAGRIAFTPDGTRLLSSNTGGQLTIWNVLSGTPLETLQSPNGPRSATLCLIVLPHGLGAVCGDNSGGLSLWRLPE